MRTILMRKPEDLLRKVYEAQKLKPVKMDWSQMIRNDMIRNVTMVMHERIIRVYFLLNQFTIVISFHCCKWETFSFKGTD